MSASLRAVALWWAVSAVGLASAGEIPSPDFARLPPIATRTVAESTGEVLSSSRAWIEPVSRDGESLVAVRSRTFQPLGTTVEERTLLRAGATVRCLEEEHRVVDAKGETVSLNMKQFRQEALPFLADTIPPDTYPPGAALLYLLGNLPLDGDGRGAFHVMGEAMVWRMLAWDGGKEEISVPAGRFSTRRLRLRPDPESLGFPGFLRPFVRYFIPEFEAWIASEAPHLAVRVKGPLGPARERDVVIELVTSGAGGT